MKKMRFISVLSLIIAILMLAGLASCAPRNPSVEGNTTAPDGETAGPEGSDTGDCFESESETEGEKLPDTDLIYYEDFEKISLSSSTDAVLRQLGWVIDGSENGAYANNTTKYSVKSFEGSKRLYLENNSSSGTDSYVIVLSAALMGKYHEENYTYQYDVIYQDASAADRYIALVSDYGGQIYNSFHFRNKGSANNQVHYNGTWYTYDVAGVDYAANTDDNAIVNKLLGKKYNGNTQAFKDISVSIRYVVDWDNGNSVYMRVNEAGYPGSGKWTLVSRANSGGNGTTYFDPDKLGAAIALKTGGKQNGYIDNIIIWRGTGEEPTDKSVSLVTSATKGCSGHKFIGTDSCVDPKRCIYCNDNGGIDPGHKFVTVSGTSDSRCSVCNGLKSSIDAGFVFTSLPVYNGPKQSKTLYKAGHGWDSDKFDDKNESNMLIVSGTNVTEFSSYCLKLIKYGYTETFTRNLDGNMYAQYKNGTSFVYLYYTASVKEVRIIEDKSSDVTAKDFGYVYNKKNSDTTIIYQYGVPMNAAGVNIKNNDEKKIDCGMIYVIKLADNSVFILDGGGYQQFDTAQIDGFMDFLRKVTGTKDGEKVRISGWYISHGHQDHMAGFALFVKKYHKSLTLERLFFNFPSVNSPTSILIGQRGNQTKLSNYLKSYFGAGTFKYIKIHTGQQIQLADILIDVIYTHEDIVNPDTALSEVANDYNNSSAVIKITVDGKTFMFYGDVNKPAMNVILANNSDKTLKCDIVQLAHHVINDLSKLYHKNQATVVLVPQSPNGATLNATRRAAMDAAKKYATNGMIYYASESTVGLRVINGVITNVFTAPVHGGRYEGWGW